MNWKRLSPSLGWKKSQPTGAQLKLWLGTDEPFRLGWRARSPTFDMAGTNGAANAFGDELRAISLGGAPGVSDRLDPAARRSASSSACPLPWPIQHNFSDGVPNSSRRSDFATVNSYLKVRLAESSNI